MTNITAAQVNELRQQTGCGLMECKQALSETNGDVAQAIDMLRKKGTIKAAKKAERATGQGRIETYVHGEGKVGVIVEILCETDFVAKNDKFKNLCHDVALHIAGTNPPYLNPESVPSEIIEKEKEIYREQLRNEGKPDNIVEKILEGKLAKFYEEHCLIKQKFIKDPDKTIEQLLTEQISVIGENMKITRYARLEMGGSGSFCQ